jgi:hypothetical protein
MAFKNYLAPNTYTNISNLIYEKQLKRCTAMLEIWADDTKKILLANKGLTVDGAIRHPAVPSLVDKENAPPADTQPDKYYIIADKAEGDFEGYEGQLTKYNPITKVWDKWVLWHSLIVFVEDEKKYYQFFNGSWSELPDMSNDARLWDTWLAPEVALSNGNNPMQQMYKLMKTLPQFKNCEDA